MTELAKKPLSVADTVELSPVGAREMAASRLTNLAVVSLQTALEVTGITQKALADMLGLGESRVSQVVNGDGNLKLTTFARYLRALGYTVGFDIQPAHAGVPALKRKRRARLNAAEDIVRVHYQANSDGESLTYTKPFKPGIVPSGERRESIGYVHIDTVPNLNMSAWVTTKQELAS